MLPWEFGHLNQNGARSVPFGDVGLEAASSYVSGRKEEAGLRAGFLSCY